MKILTYFGILSVFWNFGILSVFCIFVLKFERLSIQAYNAAARRCATTAARFGLAVALFVLLRQGGGFADDDRAAEFRELQELDTPVPTPIA